MALTAANMNMMVNGNGQSWWSYRSAADAMAAILGANYFAAFAPQLNVGDMIVINDSANVNDVAFVKTCDGVSAVTTVGLGTPVLAAAAAHDNGGHAKKKHE